MYTYITKLVMLKHEWERIWVLGLSVQGKFSSAYFHSGIKIVYPFLSVLFKLYYSYRMWLSGYFLVFLSTTAKSQKKKIHIVPRLSVRYGQSWPYGLLAANFKWFGSK